MATNATVPMFAPDGSTTGEIPQSNVQAALQAGFKPAYEMTSPDGKVGYIPQERAQDAIKAGFKLGAPDAKATPSSFSPGNLISNVGSGLKELGQGLVQGASDIGGVILPQALGGDSFKNLALVHHIVDPMQAEAAKARDPNTPAHLGHAIASGIPVIGPYAAALGEQAATDPGGAIAKGATQFFAPKMIAPAAELAVRGGSRVLLGGKSPEGAYESAMKIPPAAMSDAERAQAIQTGLKNELPVSKGGLEKLNDLVEDLNQKIKGEIAKDPARPIDPNAVATRADQAKANFAKQVNAGGDLNAIEASKQQFLQEQGAQPGQPAPAMGAANAQEMKQGTYRILRGKFGEQGSASVEAQKALARGLKEEIATQFPEIGKLNAAESKLLDLQPVLERAVNRIGNHQAFGIGTPILGASAKAITGSTLVGGAVAVYKAVFDNPIVKSRLAIAVSKADRIPYAQAVAKVQGYSTRLGQYAAMQGTSASNADNSANPPTQ